MEESVIVVISLNVEHDHFNLQNFPYFSIFSTQLVQNEQLIETVNHSNALWKAGKNKVFEGKTFTQIRNMLGTFLVDPETRTLLPRADYNVDPKNLPKEFDPRKQWPNCIHPIRNQGQCGSCWAFASAEALEDRYCIATNGAFNEHLSPQDQVSCDKGNYGCQGGYLDALWRYLERVGTVTERCWPYESGTGYEPPCRNTCTNSNVPYRKYKAKAGSTKHFRNNESAMQDLMTKGPIITGFRVYNDFMSYKSGVYHHVTGGFLGGHAVKVLGWGTDQNGVDYWIAANSWGADWGMNGFFLIRRGNDECDFESNFYVGDANV